MCGIRPILRRWIPLLLLLPLSYILRPLLWTPLDYRFYNYFHAKREVPEWNEVVVAGIDRNTIEDAFESPLYPLSRHVEAHAAVIEHLHEAGARAIVFDLELSADLFESPPEILACAIRSAGNVYLVKQIETEHRMSSDSGIELVSTREKAPHRILVEASQGAYIAHASLDSDGRFRRYSTYPEVLGVRYEAMPEKLANVRDIATFPVEVPSEKTPIPVVSYVDILYGRKELLSRIKGRIVFIGSILESSADQVSVARSTMLPGGYITRELPGVITLAAITENLTRGRPIRDAGWPQVLLWISIWCIFAVSLMPRMHPAVSASYLIVVVAIALLATGVFHIYLDIVFPAGLLFGSLFVCGVFTIISLDVQTTKELLVEEAENKSIKRDIELARRTQVAFLPEHIPQIEGIDIWGTNISSKGVSGDYYDVIKHPCDESLLIAIGDVSGKGMPASLLMSNVQAGLHSQLFREKIDLVDITTTLNVLIFQNTEVSSFVTFFLAQLLLQPLRLECVRAGHEKPLLVTADGTVSELDDGGIALGIIPDAQYSQYETKLEPGDVFCLYTDGVTEARSKAGEWFTKERLFEVILENRYKDAKSIVENIVDKVRQFSGLEKQADDITLVIVRVDPLDETQ
jgi:CHASE2 domain-containing sensor protein